MKVISLFECDNSRLKSLLKEVPHLAFAVFRTRLSLTQGHTFRIQIVYHDSFNMGLAVCAVLLISSSLFQLVF